MQGSNTNRPSARVRVRRALVATAAAIAVGGLAAITPAGASTVPAQTPCVGNLPPALPNPNACPSGSTQGKAHKRRHKHHSHKHHSRKHHGRVHRRHHKGHRKHHK